MNNLIKPLGGVLTPLLVDETEKSYYLNYAETLPRVAVSSREENDIYMMGIGGFTPLTGFINHDDWLNVCEHYQLTNGTFWPLPITLSTDNVTAKSIIINSDIALARENKIIAIMNVTEKYKINKTYECLNIYQTIDHNHPGVKAIMSQGEVNLAGSIKVLRLGNAPKKHADYFLTPAQTRAEFNSRGWKTITAFQTRNPIHRAHEHLIQQALDKTDGVLIHSILGKLKTGDIPASIRLKAIQTLIDNYYKNAPIIQAGYPLDMRYAGPREALLHAVFRQNYGCSHLIIGRDHAGVNNYYKPFASQEIFKEIPKNSLKIKTINMDLTFWCNSCNDITTDKKCNHSSKDKLIYSGTMLRNDLEKNIKISSKFSRPEVISVLREYYNNT